MLLYASGLTGSGLILYFVIRAYLQRLRIEASLATGTPQGASDA